MNTSYQSSLDPDDEFDSSFDDEYFWELSRDEADARYIDGDDE